MAFLAPLINDQQVDVNGDPLTGGTISVYLAGTSTPAATYNDRDGLPAHANSWPITLNTLGLNSQGAVWLVGGQAYKFVIKDVNLVTMRTIDYVSGINDAFAANDQWVVFGGTPTYVNATTFTLPGDQTQTFTFGTRVRTSNTGGIVTGTVVRAAYSAPNTTVTIIPDSGALDSGLSLVSVGLITPGSPSLPGTLTTPPFRNRIINGAFRTDQRNSGASQVITAGAAIAYTTDRFYVSCTGANITSQRVAGTGYQYAQTLTGAASVAATLWGQRIESSNCYDWVNKQVNVQVPISAVGITSVTWNAYAADATDNFSSKTLLANGTLTVSATVETKFFSFPAGANAGRGVAIEFVTGALVAGQSITYQGAFQAEAGQVSTFESVEVGEDLRRCQRYFASVGAAITVTASGAAQNWGVPVQWPVPMRVSPAITLGGSVTFGNVTSESTVVTGTPTLGCKYGIVNTAAGVAFVDGRVLAAAAEL
ncbi:hypothetical protein ABIC89_001068 [Variovorax boronicumulans]|uniref:hypothetical protein n=1 Tax=Variovorax boronicumulans TaxID=436515 RepID=UPI00339B54A6